MDNTDTPEDEADIPSNSLDDQPIKKCGDEVHPLIKAKRLLKKLNTLKSIEDTKCETDYHEECQKSWKDCKSEGAKTFCPKTCQIKDCASRLKEIGKHAHYSQSSKDNPKYNCSRMEEQGTCMVPSEKTAEVCPGTCGLCEKFKDYCPFSMDEHMLCHHLKHSTNRKMRKVRKCIRRKKRALKKKIANNECGGSSSGKPTKGGATNSSSNSNSNSNSQSNSGENQQQNQNQQKSQQPHSGEKTQQPSPDSPPQAPVDPSQSQPPAEQPASSPPQPQEPAATPTSNDNAPEPPGEPDTEPVMDPDLKDIDQEMNDLQDDEPIPTSFDGVKTEKCGDECHPIHKVKKYMETKSSSSSSSRTMMEVYKSERCTIDYHDSCSREMKSCNSSRANSWCPKTCQNSQCGSQLDAAGTGPENEPDYPEKCENHVRYDCRFMEDRGDCMVLSKPVSTLCPRTCCFCQELRNYLPRIPSEQKLMMYLSKSKDEKHRKIARWCKKKKTMLRHNVLKKKCSSKSKSS